VILSKRWFVTIKLIQLIGIGLCIKEAPYPSKGLQHHCYDQYQYFLLCFLGNSTMQCYGGWKSES